MAFNGKWKRTNAENALAILAHIGMPPEVIEKMKDVQTTMEFEQTGDVIKEKLTVGEKVTNEVYTIGKESEVRTWKGETVKVVPVKLGENKIKVEYEHNGIHHSAIRELTSPTEFVDNIDLDHGKAVGKFFYTKC